MSQCFLAVDIGASSGRHILGWMENGRIRLQEVYRFKNGLEKRNGHLCWDTDKLFKEIKNGLKACKGAGRIPVSMGIDTWGVDFVLLDKNDKVLGDTVGYRDNRTEGMQQLVDAIIPRSELYKRTGIQSQRFNTIYQLMAIQKQTPEILEKAEAMLLYPDYFNFLLTGNKLTEYTIGSTSGLLDVLAKDWDYDLIGMLGLKKEIFGKVHMPMTEVGSLRAEVQEEVGFNLRVLLPASHDTGSAVLAVPARDDDYIYISSGTWSLMGVESPVPNVSAECMDSNFTNEGGFGGNYRFLKNIMGLWMIQNVRRELDDKYSFDELCALARESDDFPSRLEVNDDCFLAPESMIEEIKAYCGRTGQRVPKTIGEIAASIYLSLADSYAQTADQIESITGRTYSRIHIVGGGSQAGYLNELTARATGKEIHTGPVEATAIGNLMAQMLKYKVFNSVEEARECIYNSFNVERL